MNRDFLIDPEWRERDNLTSTPTVETKESLLRKTPLADLCADYIIQNICPHNPHIEHMPVANLAPADLSYSFASILIEGTFDNPVLNHFAPTNDVKKRLFLQLKKHLLHEAISEKDKQ